MQCSNPRYVLRNYMAQNAIEAAEKGDFSEASTHPCPMGLGREWGARTPLTRPLLQVRRLLKLLEAPYGEGEAEESAGSEHRDSAKPPLWAAELCVSCSS